MAPKGLFMLILLINCMVVLVHSLKRPKIGVLMQKYGNTSYVIYSNYVKALEGSGAKVVPVRINESEAYYRSILKTLNGLVYPGGDANLLDPTDIGSAGNILYKLATELNDQGVHFPIMGVCQGLQLLAIVSAGMKNVLTPCKGVGDISLPLEFIVDPSKSRLYEDAPNDVIEILETESVTANVHYLCFTRGSVKKEGLLSTWRVTTVNHDARGLEFISSMEHTRYPFVAVQFHPEKPIYDLGGGFKFTTNYSAIVANRWFYDWLVLESQKNDHSCTSEGQECALIENYCPKLVPSSDGSESDYYFPKASSHSSTSPTASTIAEDPDVESESNSNSDSDSNSDRQYGGSRLIGQSDDVRVKLHDAFSH